MFPLFPAFFPVFSWRKIWEKSCSILVRSRSADFSCLGCFKLGLHIITTTTAPHYYWFKMIMMMIVDGRWWSMIVPRHEIQSGRHARVSNLDYIPGTTHMHSRGRRTIFNIHPSIHPSIRPSIHPSIHPSIFLIILIVQYASSIVQAGTVISAST